MAGVVGEHRQRSINAEQRTPVRTGVAKIAAFLPLLALFAGQGKTTPTRNEGTMERENWVGSGNEWRIKPNGHVSSGIREQRNQQCGAVEPVFSGKQTTRRTPNLQPESVTNVGATPVEERIILERHRMAIEWHQQRLNVTLTIIIR